MRKKEVLARLLRAGGGFRVATAVRGRSASELHVLAYHRILPAVSDAEYPFDVELISADPEQFDWQMSWLAKNFTPVSVSDVADSLDKGKALPAGAVVVTFDDGYMDNYVHAFPVLKSRGIPACIFLSTEYVGTFRPYWFESVAQVLMSAPAQSVRIPAVDEMLPRAGKRGTRREDIRWVLSVLKRLPDELRRANMAALELQVNGAGDAAARFGAHAMDWTHVKEMYRSGIEFGSHGTSHAVLTRLNAADLAREMADSRQAIEKVTGAPVVAIAYPVGGEDSINDQVIAAARDAGYRIGFTYMRGTNRATPTDPLRLARQHVERYVSRAYFQGLLALPSVFD